jgi:hypothetical protein
MIGPSNETIGSCSFEIDNLSVFAGVAEGNPSLGVVLNEVEDCQIKYDEESLSDEDQEQLLQQKKFIDFLLNKGNIPEEDETIMSRMKEPVDVGNMEQLVYLNSQEKTIGKTFGTVTEVENQNSILIEAEKSCADPERQHTDEWFEENECLKYWLKVFEKEEEVVVDEGEMSHVVRETRTYIGSQFYDVLTSMQEGLIDYVAANRKLKDKLLFESKFAGRENEKDIAEGDDYQSIQEVRVEAVSREISTTLFAAEVEARKAGKGNQQFSDERIKCSIMLWKSNEDKISLQ